MVSVFVIMSCEEDSEVKESQDNNNKVEPTGGGYSGITEVDENMVFKSVDPDDWRDDGMLKDCLVYPNPVHPQRDYIGYFYEFKIIYKLTHSAYVLVIMSDTNGKIVSNANSKLVFCNYYPTAGDYRIEFRKHSWENNAIRNLLKAGIYRLSIYASESELVTRMLQDTGTTNAEREKYSMVYGDVLIIEENLPDPGPSPTVISATIAEGQEVLPNTTITVKFSKEMSTVHLIVSGADGNTHFGENSKEASWVPVVPMLPGDHTLSISGKDTFGQELEGNSTIDFRVKKAP